MSGGRWDYGQALEDNEEALSRLTEMNAVMRAIEHEMDWGICGDTCRECSKLRALAALEQFFDDCCGNMEATVATATVTFLTALRFTQKAPLKHRSASSLLTRPSPQNFSPRTLPSPTVRIFMKTITCWRSSCLFSSAR